MATKRARKRLRQARIRLTGRAPITRRQARGGRRADRTGARSLALKSTTRFFAKKRISQVGPGGGVRAVGRAALKSTLGKRLATIARQRLSKVPGLGRAFGTTRRAQTPLVNFGSRAPAVRGTRSLAVRSAAPIAIGAGAGGVAFEAGRRIFDAIPGGLDVVRGIRSARGRRTGGSAIPFSPGGIVPTDSITHTWVANGVPFAQLADGRVMVRRKNGTIKTFRRPRPIVLGRNPGVRDLVRADKKIDALLKLVKKRFPARRTAAPRHSQQHN